MKPGEDLTKLNSCSSNQPNNSFTDSEIPETVYKMFDDNPSLGIRIDEATKETMAKASKMLTDD